MHCKDFGINEESAKQSQQTNFKKVNEGEKNTNQLINEKHKRAYVKLKHKNKKQNAKLPYYSSNTILAFEKHIDFQLSV